MPKVTMVVKMEATHTSLQEARIAIGIKLMYEALTLIYGDTVQAHAKSWNMPGVQISKEWDITK